VKSYHKKAFTVYIPYLHSLWRHLLTIIILDVSLAILPCGVYCSSWSVASFQDFGSHPYHLQGGQKLSCSRFHVALVTVWFISDYLELYSSDPRTDRHPQVSLSPCRHFSLSAVYQWLSWTIL